MLKARMVKRLGGFLLDVNLAVEPGITVFSGPSGCGKTTALRCLCGILRPDAGRIELDGETWFDSHHKTNVPARLRRVSYVPQGYALFPHLTVEQNVAYGLDRRHKEHNRGQVNTLLDMVRLGDCAGKYPGQLSGGQKQRVALARALATAPRLLLLDEPFAALDRDLKEELLAGLEAFLLESGIAHVILVTHDRSDALRLSSRTAVFDRGRIRRVEKNGCSAARPAGSGRAAAGIWTGGGEDLTPELYTAQGGKKI